MRCPCGSPNRVRGEAAAGTSGPRRARARGQAAGAAIRGGVEGRMGVYAGARAFATPKKRCTLDTQSLGKQQQCSAQ